MLRINEALYNNIYIRKNICFQSDKNTKADTSKSNMLYLSLAAVAVLGVVGMMCKGANKKPVPIKTCTIQEFNETLSAKEMKCIEEELAKLDFSKDDLLKDLKISHQTDIFKRLYALLKTKPSRPVEIPNIISSDAREEELKKIGDIFSREFAYKTKEIKYEKSPSDFLDSLEKVSKNDENTCITINNFEKFYQESDNKSKEKFQSLFNDKTIFIIKESPEIQINGCNKISLAFEKH